MNENVSEIKLDIRNFQPEDPNNTKIMLMFCKIPMLGRNFEDTKLLVPTSFTRDIWEK